MKGIPDTTDVIVVGAGMAGLTAADELRKAGVSAIVLDKGRAPGGRMATRTIDGARFDHGAQHFSARSDQFRARVRQLQDMGVVAEWYTAKSWTTPGADAEPRLVGIGGMRRIPEHIAAGLDVRTSVTIDRLDRIDGGIAAIAGDLTIARASGVVLTPPVPQLLALLNSSDLMPKSDRLESLDAVRYNASLTVMASLDEPSGLPQGHLGQPTQNVAWIADNQHKGTSDFPAVTIHSTADFARAHLREDRDTWARQLCDEVVPLLTGEIIAATAHRWMYAEPQTTFDSGAMELDLSEPVILAGEVFAGAKVEGAFLSGVAAAQAALERL